MSYLICFGIVVAAGCILTLVSNGFADAMSRMLEAGFDHVEYRLALRAQERRTMRQGAQAAKVATPFRVADIQSKGKRSTQQLGIARVAA
jgi:hypothetical protein